MAQEFLEYKIKKQFADIDRLITELVITRKYINSTRIGLIRCREHIVGSPLYSGENDFMKNQEQLLNRLKIAEKRIKKQIRDSSKELGFLCCKDRFSK
ncbi:MAG: hypothetical protein ACOY46_14940 [Bacillota bacterium]